MQYIFPSFLNHFLPSASEISHSVFLLTFIAYSFSDFFASFYKLLALELQDWDYKLNCYKKLKISLV